MTSTTPPGNDFLDILFNGRNKEYGAYALRRKYDQRVRNAILGTASIALVVIGGYALNNKLVASATHTRTLPSPIVLDHFEMPVDEVKTPPPPPPPASAPAPARPSVAFVAPVISREVEETEVPPITELQHSSVGLTTTTGDVNGIDADALLPQAGTGGIVEAPVVAEREDRDHVFTGVEIPPSFPGGEEALARYLGSHLHYPQLASETGVSGIVFVQFVVDYEGNVKDVKPVGARKGAGLEEEAARVIKGMPKWRPGKQNGRTVSVLYNIPVNFHLEN